MVDSQQQRNEPTCNQLLLLLDNWKVHTTAEFKSAVEEKFKGKVKLRFLPPNMTHKLQPLDVSINSALKTKTEAVYSFEYGKKIADLISKSAQDDRLAEQIVQIEKSTKPKVKREDAIDCTYKAWQQIETSLVQKAWLDCTILDAWDIEVQEEALRLFENGLLLPMDPETNRVNVFPDAVPCEAPLQVLEDKDTTSENEIEYSIRDTDDESHNEEPSEGDHAHPIIPGEGGLEQDQAIDHNHVYLWTSTASKGFIYIYCNLLHIVSTSDRPEIQFWHSKTLQDKKRREFPEITKS
ncbi:hypothetical protein PSENEW3n2_00000931 [Picochlorum sp. SENEW3]|nr:hypothetical protein PSENEW3n2_00000931 [Picochlorum sp. SENEW3]WPT14987.1 hypothetical protein PSENEW3_00000931 [Picochlorum sp. SENEW3]